MSIQQFSNNPLQGQNPIEVSLFSEIRPDTVDIQPQLPYRLPFHSIGLVTQGVAEYETDFKPYRAERGTLLLFAPQKVLRLRSPSGWDGIIARFLPEFLLPARASGRDASLFLQFRQLPQQTVLSAPQFSMLERHLRALWQYLKLEVDGPLKIDLLRHQLYGLLNLIVLFGPSASPENNRRLARFQQFEALLESQFARQHRLGAYARQLHCTERSLSRASLEVVGIPAKAVISARLALEAKRLLAYTDDNIQQIADQLGFADAAVFGKFFKRETAMLPTAFRKWASVLS